MKLSEKTLELNICAQATHFVSGRQRLFWFGLTQKQEAKAGFDACTKLGGRLLIFQFKASNRLLKSRQRVFLAPHAQLQALHEHVGSHMRSVFYAFPMVGNTAELSKNTDLLSQTWLVDVAQLGGLGLPTKADGTLRRNTCHNVYVTPGKATFHSDPISLDAQSLQGLVTEGFPGSDGVYWAFNQRFESFWEFASILSSGALGLVVW